ncbi:MAG TPA: COX15/CtaA family protein [Myxococcales bacterium]|nr:COX15/CtaA family protein [Myxococcales bacterium]HET9753549.1 COX15/CtaA family protein [Myxococcales bacterium]
MIRRLAAAAAFLTVVLIVAGGLVTNTDSGLACPDWPTCFGSVAPRMVGGVAVEHTHRLIATAVGLCTVALVVLTLRRARQGWLAAALAAFAALVLGASFWSGSVKHATDRLPPLGVALVVLGFAGCGWAIARARELDGKLASGALAIVMFQGLLGGLTVLYRLPTLVLVMHLGTSMLFLAVALVLALHLNGTQAAAAAPRGLLWVTAAAVYAQILLGATVRHTGAGLVCIDLPYCRGAWWPSNVHPMVHLHMAHRAFAFVVLGLVGWTSARVARSSRGPVRALALLAPLLVLVQIALGVFTILTLKDLLPLTGHLLVGALLLADCVALLAITRAEPAQARAAAAVRLA